MSVDAAHTRPAGTSDATVAALGKLSEALEVVEDARGQLYDFHRKCGMADLTLGEAVEMLRDAGHDELADRIDTDLVGPQHPRRALVVPGRRGVRRRLLRGLQGARAGAREQLMDGKRHVFEAEMKQDRRTHGRPGHAATPADGASS